MLWRQAPSWNLQSGWGDNSTVVRVYNSEKCYGDGYVVLWGGVREQEPDWGKGRSLEEVKLGLKLVV